MVWYFWDHKSTSLVDPVDGPQGSRTSQSRKLQVHSVHGAAQTLFSLRGNWKVIVSAVFAAALIIALVVGAVVYFTSEHATVSAVAHSSTENIIGEDKSGEEEQVGEERKFPIFKVTFFALLLLLLYVGSNWKRNREPQQALNPQVWFGEPVDRSKAALNRGPRIDMQFEERKTELPDNMKVLQEAREALDDDQKCTSEERTGFTKVLYWVANNLSVEIFCPPGFSMASVWCYDGEDARHDADVLIYFADGAFKCTTSY